MGNAGPVCAEDQQRLLNPRSGTESNRKMNKLHGMTWILLCAVAVCRAAEEPTSVRIGEPQQAVRAAAKTRARDNAYGTEAKVIP